MTTELDLLATGLDDPERARLSVAVQRASEIYAGKVLGTGEAALQHALGLAGNIAALRLDADTRIAGLLFAVPEYAPAGGIDLHAEFGAQVAMLVDGITRLNSLRVLTRNTSEQAKTASKTGPSQAEVLRKMLLAIVEDIRVVLLRLASRTQTMRFLAASRDTSVEEHRIPVARETLDIYAPLANRLGVWQLKWELEDLSFRFLEPDTYQRIAAHLDERRGERETYVPITRESR